MFTVTHRQLPATGTALSVTAAGEKAYELYGEGSYLAAFEGNTIVFDFETE